MSDTETEAPKPPAGLQSGGKALWSSVLRDFDLDEHERRILLEACRATDQLDKLDRAVRNDGTLIDTPQGLKAHPALVEARQQRVVLARLISALRLPDGEQSAGQPQRRSGFRGVYAIKGGAS